RAAEGGRVRTEAAPRVRRAETTAMHTGPRTIETTAMHTGRFTIETTAMHTGALTIETTEMHTGGEPVRIVTAGYPPIPGATILAKRRYAREHLDHLRRFLLFEPRGHFDMYGVIPVAPDHPEADLAVLFMHNEGYRPMCGHAVIAVGRRAVGTGR